MLLELLAQQSLLLRLTKLHLLTEANASAKVLELARTNVARQDDDCILEAHVRTIGSGDKAIVEDLQEYIVNVRVRLLQLVKEYDRVGLASHLLRELSALIVADVARGCAHETRDVERLHIFTHINTYECVLIVKE